jgi:hypothetical protein
MKTVDIVMIPIKELQKYLEQGYFIDRIRSSYKTAPKDYLFITKDEEAASFRFDQDNLRAALVRVT